MPSVVRYRCDLSWWQISDIKKDKVDNREIYLLKTTMKKALLPGLSSKWKTFNSDPPE